MQNIFKEHEILLENSDPKEVLKTIKRYLNKSEKIYVFKSGIKADLLYEQKTINKLSLNYFQIYDKKIFNSLEVIKGMFETFCKEKNINKKISRYYIASELEESFSEKYWYESGGSGTSAFSGYWFLDCDEEAKMIIEDESINIYSGTIVLFDASKKCSFLKANNAISFNITTLSKIINQYPQKWMPL